MQGGNGEFVWHDLMTTEVEAARSFYSGLFPEWALESIDLGEGALYVKIGFKGQDRGGMLPLSPAHGLPSHWIPYIAVPDCDAAVARAEELGGRCCVPPMDAPGVGRFAVVDDPLGASFKPFQREAGLPQVAPSPGAPVWHELKFDPAPEGAPALPEATALKAFYAGVLGWDAHLEGQGEGTFHLDGAPFAALRARSSPTQARATWVAHFAVPDVEARVARALSLGASEARREEAFVELHDPTGAGFALRAL